MKFSELPIGSRFELDGTTYRKSSPMLASPEDGGSSKFLARFARVVPLDAVPPKPRTAPRMVGADDALAAFDVCLAGIAERLGETAELRAALDQGREQFVAALNNEVKQR